jgi:hypothetical protein
MPDLPTEDDRRRTNEAVAWFAKMVTIQEDFQKIFPVLGRLAVVFNYLERDLKVILTLFRGEPFEKAYSKTILTKIYFRDVLDQLNKIVLPRCPNLVTRERLEDILGKVAKLAEKRNELLHSLWFPPQEVGGSPIQLKEDSQIFGQQRNPGEILTPIKEIEALRATQDGVHHSNAAT